MPRPPGRSRAFRRERPALEIGEGRCVRRDHAAASAGLDRHVAERQPAFHRQRADRACRQTRWRGLVAPSAPNACDDRECDVLAPQCRRPIVPSTVMRMRFGFFCQSVCVISTCSDLRRADPEGIARRMRREWRYELSPQTISSPGKAVRPCSGPTTCTMIPGADRAGQTE